MLTYKAIRILSTPTGYVYPGGFVELDESRAAVLLRNGAIELAEGEPSIMIEEEDTQEELSDASYD